MNDSPGSLDLLSIRVDELEKRVFALEHPQHAAAAVVPAQSQVADNTSSKEPSVLDTAKLFPTLGRAMLGVAGAYLLRALASANAAPRIAIAAFAIAYGFAWLVWAARLSKSNSLASTIYATTSVLILAPMLWETTLHFQTFSPIATAGVLGAFAILASALCWRAESQRILWIAYTGTAITGVVLSLSTHHLLPFLYLLLLLALAGEIPRMLGFSRSMWWLVAFTADAAMWGMIFIYGGPPESRADYPYLAGVVLVGPPFLLFAIYATSISVRVVAREENITILEVIQSVLVFLLAICAVLYLIPQAGTVPIGIACLVLTSAGYAVSFRSLRRVPMARNFQVFGLWSAALLIAGITWTIPKAAPILIALAAACACALATRIDCTMLELHGALFAVFAAVISRLPQFVFGTLAGSPPDTPGLKSSIVILCIAAAYALTNDRADQKWTHQLVFFISALIGTSGLVALLVSHLLSALRPVILLEIHHLAFIRALVLSLTALFLAFAGSRSSRPSMKRLSYVALVVLGAKLLFEDLRHSHMDFIAASIFLFAVTLIAVPRLARSGNKVSPNPVSNAAPDEAVGKQKPMHVG